MNASFFALLWGCSPNEGKRTYENPRELQTIEDIYWLEVTHAPDPPVTGEHQLEVLLMNVDQTAAVLDASISVEPYMPSMSHGIGEQPSVVNLGEGFYTIDFSYSMPGEWELRFVISSILGTDSVSPVYEVQ